MAEIVNFSVFTNDGITCSSNSSSSNNNSTDLLQQAFQEVVDDDADERENEFVAFFKDESGNHQTIRLTREQATGLGLTFEVDSLIDKTNCLNYQQEQEHLLNDIESVTTGSIKVNEEHHENMNQIEFPVTCEWISHAETIGSDTPRKNNQQAARAMNEMDEELGEAIGEKTTRGYLLQNLKVVGKKDSREASIINQQDAIPIHRSPITLPQSQQYMVKPAQTILKTGKNIKLLDGTSNKIQILNTSVQSTINAPQNSLLYQKSNFHSNGLNIQAIKNTQITSQIINGNSIMNGTNGQIRMSPLIKTAQNIQRGGNSQQFFTSISKTTEPARNFKTHISINKTNLVPPLLKSSSSVPVTQIARNGNLVKTTMVNQTKAANAQIIFKTTPKLKTQDLKTVMANNGNAAVRHTNAQLSSTSVSILKPQTKVAFTNSNKQNMISQATKLIKKVSSSPQTTIEHKVIKNSLQNPTNLQCLHGNLLSLKNNNQVKSIDTNHVIAAAAAASNENGVKSMKKNLKATGERQNSVSTLQNDIKNGNKSNGGGGAAAAAAATDNAIQLVQQGHTFHSTQKLTKTQLKQIAHVLQQRGHEESSSISKEKVVYRVVFPEELDLRIRNPSNNLLKGARGKRGRPKKTPTMRNTAPIKTGMTDEETEELKEERKKVVARTRSGRLSRPPRHMVRDYKHLHPVDFMQPDLDDSDGGYSDYNTNTMINGKAENLEQNKELLAGLEVPKRKVSTHFRCSTCNKIYLGRARMAKHFELYPDHGSLESLPPSTTGLTTNGFTDHGDNKKSLSSIPVDSFKRKGKKRGPWAYVTPEEKSERRQAKLREALSVCDSGEISKIAAKPVLNAQSLYDLMTIKSDNNVRVFLDELKVFMEKIREQAGIMLSPISDKEKKEKNLIDLGDELLCDALGLVPGIYSVNDHVFKKPEADNLPDPTGPVSSEPPIKLQKLHNDEGKENIEERLSSGFSESSDLSISDFLTERKNDSNCPEVLTALTLMPRNPSPVITEANKNNISKLLISSPQIQRQISDNPGFQKVDINASKSTCYSKIDSTREGLTKLTNGINISDCSQVFTKLENNFEHAKMEITQQQQQQQQTFIKLEPIQQNFIKLENGDTTVGTYAKKNTCDLRDELDHDNFHNLTDTTQNFAKGFQKIISNRIVTMNNHAQADCEKVDALNSIKTVCKVESNNMQMLQDSVPMIANNCDHADGIFGSTDNLDHMSHLDYSVVMDKHLIMDEKLVEQLHLVDQSNLVDELVSERLKNIMSDNILDNNLMPNSTNLVTELDFEAISEEFNRNTSS